MNNVALIGRLTKKPEVRYTQGPDPMAVASFTLAVNRSKSRGEEADFIRITVFGRQAENCERYLDKGRQVAVQGRIQTGSYTNKDGATVYTTDVVAERVEFFSRPQISTESAEPARDEQVGFKGVLDDDLPF